MIELNSFFRQVRQELLDNRNLSSEVCRRYKELSLENQSIFKELFLLLGCEVSETATFDRPLYVRKEVRLECMSLFFLKMFVDTDDPKWSSEYLQLFIRRVLEIPGATSIEILESLFDFYREFKCSLTEVMANFILDIIKCCFWISKHNLGKVTSFTSSNLAQQKLLPVQALLLVYTLPEESLDSEIVVNILQSLAGSIYLKVALQELQETIIAKNILIPLYDNGKEPLS